MLQIDWKRTYSLELDVYAVVEAFSLRWSLTATLLRTGMATDPLVLAHLKRRGLGTLNPEQGMDVLAGILSAAVLQPRPQIGAFPIDWSIVLKKV